MFWLAVTSTPSWMVRKLRLTTAMLFPAMKNNNLLSSTVRPQLGYELAGSSLWIPSSSSTVRTRTPTSARNILEEFIWFAVPKRKHTRSRKRMKTTVQKKIPIKKNIVFDPRTGEVTLKHKLPFNWKDYLPKLD
mmetsp:Transcript_11064/g.17754  ORF Transcript_11064/g.17754 Transcript_11064/m.17754 type:complete len:134 (-) Transcript_11064:115-516(-)